jgi:hypothetical protein
MLNYTYVCICVCIYTHTYEQDIVLSVYPLKDTCIAFWLLWKILLSFWYTYIHSSSYFNICGAYIRSGISESYINVMIIYLKTWHITSAAALIFLFLLVMFWFSASSIVYVLGVMHIYMCMFFTAILPGTRWFFIVVSICIFLNTCNVFTFYVPIGLLHIFGKWRAHPPMNLTSDV